MRVIIFLLSELTGENVAVTNLRLNIKCPFEDWMMLLSQNLALTPSCTSEKWNGMPGWDEGKCAM